MALETLHNEQEHDEKDVEQVPKRRPHILVVEDNEMQAKILEEYLRDAGYGVMVAKDAYTAIAKINYEHFDLIISDINMPWGISGFDLLRTVRSNDSRKKIPFMIVTGRSERADIEKAILTGVDDYIVKPVDGSMFLAKTEKLLSKSATLHAFFEHQTLKPANIAFDLKIVGVSEQGLSIISPIPMSEGYKLQFESAFFEELGIRKPKLRVINCESTENKFAISTTFIGLNEKEMGAIRRWIMAHAPKKVRRSN